MAALWLETGTPPEAGGLLDQSPEMLQTVVDLLEFRAKEAERRARQR